MAIAKSYLKRRLVLPRPKGVRGPAQRYMLSSTRLRSPKNISGVLTGSNIFQMTRIFCGKPNWNPVDPIIAYDNYYLSESGTPKENLTGNPINLTVCNLEFGGSNHQALMDGSPSATIADGGYALFKYSGVVDSDWWVRTAFGVASGGRCPYPFTNIIPTNGEGIVRASTSRDSVANSLGSVSPALNSQVYGPSAIFSKGWDGITPVFLILGDSHATPQGVGEYELYTADARGNIGYLERGLDSPSGGRCAFGQFALAGSNTFSTDSILEADGEFFRRYRLLKAIYDMNGGRWPFTHILNELSTSDAGIGDPAWPNRVDEYADILNTFFPGVPIVQATFMPKVTNAANNWGTTLTGQSMRTDYGPGSGYAAANAKIRANASGKFRAIIDAVPSVVSASDVYKYPVSSWSGTLAADTSVGATSFIVTAASAPPAEWWLVLEPDVSNSDCPASPILSATDNANGTFTITTGTQGAATKAHLAGTSVKVTAIRDGVHFTSALHKAGTAAVVAAKASFGAVA